MKGHGTKFTRKKEEAIAALLTQRNTEEAAKTIGVAPNTLLRWMKEPEFDAAYRVARRAAFGQSVVRLHKRIAHLEVLSTPRKRVLTEKELAFGASLDRLLATMDPQHAHMVRQDLQHPREMISHNRSRYTKLTMIAIRSVFRHMASGTPLALPASVVSVYLDDPAAVALHDCEDCGYVVPFGCPEPYAEPPKPARVYFQRCPLCGGKVGYCAFHNRNAFTALCRPEA